MRDAWEIARLSAAELAAAYADGSLSPTEAVDAALVVVDDAEPEINALWDRAHEPARVAARESTERWRRGEPDGPLDGVPATVKENLARAGRPDAGRQRGRGPDPARAELTGRRAAHRGRCGDPRLHGHARLGNALVRRLEPARHHPQSLGPGPHDGRVVVRRGSRRRGRLRPPQRRHRHRRLDPAARHLAGSGGVQAQLRSRAARHPLPRAGGRSDDPHGRGRGADDVGDQPPRQPGLDGAAALGPAVGRGQPARRRPCEGCGSG